MPTLPGIRYIQFATSTSESHLVFFTKELIERYYHTEKLENLMKSLFKRQYNKSIEFIANFAAANRVAKSNWQVKRGKLVF